MKKILTIIGAAVFSLALFSSCEQSDCLGYDSWDGSDMNANDCARMENDNTVEVNGNEVVASNVSCSTSW